MSKPKEEVFEISDFTTVTEWEKFISNLEETIANWKLSSFQDPAPTRKCPLSGCKWWEEQEQVQFFKFKFNLTRFTAKPIVKTDDEIEVDESSVLPQTLLELANQEEDFPHCQHPIGYWYGLSHFLVLSPTEAQECIMSEDRAKLLLSSLAIALGNTECHVPSFVQLWERSKNLFLGLSIENSLLTNYDAVYLYRTPQSLLHLSGLVELFKGKVSDIQDMKVSSRSKFVLKDWPLDSWPQPPMDMDEHSEHITPKELAALIVGALEDPVEEIHLYTSWPNLSEDSLVDNPVHSDLNVMESLQWSLNVRFSKNPSCSLSDSLVEFSRLLECFRSNQTLLGDVISLDNYYEDDNAIPAASKAFDRLTESGRGGFPSLGTALGTHNLKLHAWKPGRQNVLLKNATLTLKFVQFIFPDACSPLEEQLEEETYYDVPEPLLEALKSIKSAPVDSLTYRLTLALAKANSTFGGVKAVAKLWNHFLQEVFYRWENNSSLPSLEPGTPDFNCSLIHQKLQMLNYCIEKRRLSELKASGPQVVPDLDLDEEEEEEFFDCDEVETPTVALPDGRLKKLADLWLLDGSAPLYIPITQEPAPLTEDGLAEQAEALVRLGTDKDGANLRARMQSACLLSDMEAFKAANPGSCLADFVRWYSPRDWIIAEEADDASFPSNPDAEEADSPVALPIHRLSSRMRVEGNIWKEAWDTCRPVPARRQKRLFDEIKEAERVKHFLSNLTVAELVKELLPVLIHAAILKLDRACQGGPAFLAPLLIQSAKLAVSGYKNNETIDLLYKIELALAQIQSLKTKFESEESESNFEDDFSLAQLIHALVEYPMVQVPGAGRGPIGKRIVGLFENYVDHLGSVPTGNFLKPAEREFIMRGHSVSPKDGTALPQKMYARLSQGEFRLAAATTQETVFYHS